MQTRKVDATKLQSWNIFANQIFQDIDSILQEKTFLMIPRNSHAKGPIVLWNKTPQSASSCSEISSSGINTKVGQDVQLTRNQFAVEFDVDDVGARIAGHKTDDENAFPRHLHRVGYGAPVHHDLQLSLARLSHINCKPNTARFDMEPRSFCGTTVVLVMLKEIALLCVEFLYLCFESHI